MSQGITLLKNVGDFLPLDNKTIQSLASVGPTKDGQDCQGDYGGRAPFLIGMTDGLKRWIANVNEATGCSIAGNDSSGIAQAVTAAASSNGRNSLVWRLLLPSQWPHPCHTSCL